MCKTRPTRSYSLPVVMRTMKEKCLKCDNELAENEKCPCIDDVYPAKINSKQSLRGTYKTVSQPVLELPNDKN